MLLPTLIFHSKNLFYLFLIEVARWPKASSFLFFFGMKVSLRIYNLVSFPLLLRLSQVRYNGGTFAFFASHALLGSLVRVSSWFQEMMSNDTRKTHCGLERTPFFLLNIFAQQNTCSVPQLHNSFVITHPFVLPLHLPINSLALISHQRMLSLVTPQKTPIHPSPPPPHALFFQVMLNNAQDLQNWSSLISLTV